MKKALRICIILIVGPLVVPIAVVWAAVAAMSMMLVPLVGFVLTGKWSWPWE